MRFGLTPEAYLQLLDQQGGVCAICGNAEKAFRNGKRKNLAVDHDHTTGRVRGLLCTACNQGIGSLRDDPRLLRAALNYVLAHIGVKENELE